MKNYSNIPTIRYMGNKGKLLNKIIPFIEDVVEVGDIICDIMAGTNSIGYALKDRNIIVSNDIQYYSFVIAKAMLENYDIPNEEIAHKDLDSYIDENRERKVFSFFVENYTDTYFAGKQCEDIDSIRYAIDKIEGNKKYFYLTLLMNAMCKAQSTTGHFAQFMDKDHERIKPLREMSIYDLFFQKISEFKDFITSKYDNYEYNLDYKELFKEKIMDQVKCFYLDSPYTTDQYSRFYHILETVCKYDYPTVSYKAKYRDDRIKSGFCYKSTVRNEFENIISFVKAKNASLIISYSNHGVIPIKDIEEIGRKYFKNVQSHCVDYEHSSQGKGKINIKETIIIMR